MNYYALIPDRKQAFQCDSFRETYKECEIYATSN